ncbi:hypothetical protein EMIT013CA1_20415 [Bacillus sp. IT-13CA1]
MFSFQRTSLPLSKRPLKYNIYEKSGQYFFEKVFVVVFISDQEKL